MPDTTDDVARISWDAVESTTAYRVGYRVTNDAIWMELSDVTATSTEKTLSCGSYDFRVRAKWRREQLRGQVGLLV